MKDESVGPGRLVTISLKTDIAKAYTKGKDGMSWSLSKEEAISRVSTI